MFLRAVVYSKVTEVKLMLYDSDPNNARMIMKYNTFHSMNPIYGRERKIFQINPVLQCNAQFPFKCQCKQSFIKGQSLCVFLKYFNTSLKFDFSMFSKRQKQCFLKEKLVVHFPKRILTISMRKHKIKS
jgi:hypothetical protein